MAGTLPPVRMLPISPIGNSCPQLCRGHDSSLPCRFIAEARTKFARPQQACDIPSDLIVASGADRLIPRIWHYLRTPRTVLLHSPCSPAGGVIAAIAFLGSARAGGVRSCWMSSSPACHAFNRSGRLLAERVATRRLPNHGRGEFM